MNVRENSPKTTRSQKPLPRSRQYRFEQGEPLSPWREKLYEIIFEAHTPAGKAFDVFLIFSILASVGAVMLDSVSHLHARYGDWLYLAEWVFTLAFTIEYVLRLLSVRRPWLYATSFYGIVDLISIIPTYLSFLIPGVQYLLVIRVLRVLRVFRVFKLAKYLNEANMLAQALRASRRKIMVFLYTVLLLVVVAGSLMYLVEGRENGFTSIPKSVYWAIVTLTTVGYGDIAPVTPVGQTLASVIMIMGYGIIAVPTGIYTAELSRVYRGDVSNIACMNCSAEGHDPDADYCKFCGASLDRD